MVGDMGKINKEKEKKARQGHQNQQRRHTVMVVYGLRWLHIVIEFSILHLIHMN